MSDPAPLDKHRGLLMFPEDRETMNTLLTAYRQQQLNVTSETPSGTVRPELILAARVFWAHAQRAAQRCLDELQYLCQHPTQREVTTLDEDNVASTIYYCANCDLCLGDKA